MIKTEIYNFFYLYFFYTFGFFFNTPYTPIIMIRLQVRIKKNNNEGGQACHIPFLHVIKKKYIREREFKTRKLLSTVCYGGSVGFR